jgi:hypothetical protein
MSPFVVRLLALLQAMCPAAVLAAAPAVPTLAVDATCRQAEQRQGPGLKTYDACMKDEGAARGQLAAGAWSRAKADTRKTCLANATTGGLESYIDLLTCVQLFEGTVIAPADRQ